MCDDLSLRTTLSEADNPGTPPPVVAISSHVPMHSEPAAFSRNHIVPRPTHQCDTRDTRTAVTGRGSQSSQTETRTRSPHVGPRREGPRGRHNHKTHQHIDIQSSTHYTLPHLTRHRVSRSLYSIPLRDQTYLDITSQTTPQIIAHRQNCVPCFHARSFARSIIRAAEDFTTQRPSHLSPPVAAPCITAPLR